MNEQHYRLQRPDEFMVSAEGFQSTVDCGQTPVDPRFPLGQWSCDSSDCVVREVQVASKHLGRRPPKAPPEMRCPDCNEPMRFLNYLREVLLVPVSQPNHPDAVP